MGYLRKLLPSYLKLVMRFIYYPQQRAKVFREPKIKETQNKNIKEFDTKAKKLILFLIAGADYDTGIDKISGGIISIVSLCEESKKQKAIHGAEVVLCTLPRQHLLLKHTQFNNDTNVFRYGQLASYFNVVEDVLIHLPEYLCQNFLELNYEGEFGWLKQDKKLHVNILNQSIMLMPSLDKINELKHFASLVTATTAHQQYCTPTFRALYQIPLHKFSVWVSPEKYFFKPYSRKKNLLIVSPDIHPDKEFILSKLKNEVPHLKVQVIQNLTYEQYKDVISDAKWAVTFGEGLDGYILEPIFSGAIGFAVYNEDFFTEDFKLMKGIYTTYENMAESIVHDLNALDNHEEFTKTQAEQFQLCAKYYNFSQYQENIKKFYLGDYTFK